MCKVSSFLNTILIPAGVLHCFLKVLQNCSESVKKALLSVKKMSLPINYSGFRRSHTKSTIKVQTFGHESAETRFDRQKPWSGEQVCAKPEGEHDFEPKSL